ncbi:MSHA biogenesis protein MshJ [Marinobacter fuscus]|uniref:MSHA biogenesis protein MshJ n=1 Tax=Marinobacter fuscus TaxID=2109942 RepID=A0A2T1K7Q2_9GAMM|nr:MSHA biogenesis protein MshJ [Marinobacter fuscus]PSF05552.1 MSHA biogenesis protein MshJ [Marinobacter fuscus]
MTGFRNAWQSAATWYGDRTLRERMLLLATLCLGAFFITWQGLVAPVEAQTSELRQRLQAAEVSRDALLARQQILESQLAEDPSQMLKERLQERKERLARLDREITETTGRLIAPQDMVALLKRILEAQDGLRLESMLLMPPAPVYPEAQADAGNRANGEAKPLLYAHDVEMRVQGSYLDFLGYLEQLEAMDERLGWQRLEYDVGDWPKGVGILRVRTLGLNRAWLGV